MLQHQSNGREAYLCIWDLISRAKWCDCSRASCKAWRNSDEGTDCHSRENWCLHKKQPVVLNTLNFANFGCDIGSWKRCLLAGPCQLFDACNCAEQQECGAWKAADLENGLSASSSPTWQSLNRCPSEHSAVPRHHLRLHQEHLRCCRLFSCSGMSANPAREHSTARSWADIR